MRVPAFLVFLFLFFCQNVFCQMPSAEERSVQLSATVSNDPPQIDLTWKQDPSANEYVVYRKFLDDLTWGTPVATLPGTATSYSDQDVEVGVGYEYAFFKEDFSPRVDTVCIYAGTEVNFTMNDMYGIGMCCSFGFGGYEVENCGIQASGSDFGNSESTVFTVCDDGSGCSEIIITMKTDMFENSNSWNLKNNITGATIATSGSVGSFAKPRPEFGFIYVGIELPEIEDRGKVLLLVEQHLPTVMPDEIEQLKIDFIGDGYQVLTLEVDPNDSPNNVRTSIQNLKNEHPELGTVFILGHIPIAYSGDIMPDTHFELRGAYPADVYYGELNGNWTDDVVDNTSANFPIYFNTPGDGRFDQDSIPTGEVELSVGRVDFFDMPSFPQDVDTLLKNYLQKNHAFKTRQINPVRRALIDDNFMQSFAGPAASGFRNFATMFGADSIHQKDYFSTMQNESYLWSYGCGGGSIVSSGGIGSTSDFANSNLQTVFTMLFGSQFGNWAYPDVFLRAPLANGQTLTNVWAGNPPWTFHHMAMGYPIGFSTLKTQNESNELYLGNGPQLVHVALMGDPTLRMHMVAPSTKITFVPSNNSIAINWDEPENEIITGYHLYRADSLDGKFERINDSILTDTFFTDVMPNAGENWYMVRTVKLENSASGSYFNLSLGRIDSIFFSPAIPLVPGFTANEEEGCVDDLIEFTDNSTGTILNYDWTFAGGTPATSTMQNPQVQYPTTGVYDVSLTITDAFGMATETKTNYIVINDVPVPNFSYTLDEGTIQITDNTSGANSYSWDFGDSTTSIIVGDVSHIYDASGMYTVSLTVTNECGTTTYEEDIEVIISSLRNIEFEESISIFPNPANDFLTIDFGENTLQNFDMEILNTLGQSIFYKRINSTSGLEEINVAQFAQGVYFLKIKTGELQGMWKVVVE